MATTITVSEWTAGGDGKLRGIDKTGSWGTLPQYAIGVPHPENRWLAFNPLTEPRPSDPAEWPSAENSLFYYIDNSDGAATDTDNTYGYPDKPRLSIPEVNALAGTVMVIKGTGYDIGGDNRWDMTFNGTMASPCWVVAEGVGNQELVKEFRIKDSSWLIVDGLYFATNGPILSVGNYSNSPCDHICIRNIVAEGPGTAAGSNAVIVCDGNATTRTTDIVMYNNAISDFGDELSASENDYHAALVGAYCTDIYILGQVSSGMGGDSVQIGSAGGTGLERPDRVFVAKGTFSGDRENAIDVKSSVDVILSENDISGYATSSSSSGEGIIIHNNSEWCWTINNKITDCVLGVSATNSVNCFVLGNEISHTTGSIDFSSPYFEPNTAIAISGGGPFSVAHNTTPDTGIGFQVTSGVTLTGSYVYGNIFGERPDLSPDDGWDFMVENSVASTSLTADYNGYADFRGRISSTDYNDLTSWNSAPPGYDSNAVNSDPLYDNPASDIYTLQAGSPMLSIVATEDPAYASFDTRYGTTNGLSLRYDIDGNAKPTTDADAGAYQRV